MRHPALPRRRRRPTPPDREPWRLGTRITAAAVTAAVLVAATALAFGFRTGTVEPSWAPWRARHIDVVRPPNPVLSAHRSRVPIQSLPPAAMPAVGQGIGDLSRTCRRSALKRTPTRGSECTLWDVSGPVNVVITTRGAVPMLAMIEAGWRPAAGNWLIAQGFVDQFPGCVPGWRDSREQLELRLDRTSRRHVKLVHVDCSPAGTVVVFGTAHTDAYDLRRCAGDHTVEYDAARDAIVNSLRGRPDVTVIYRRVRPRGTQYAGGCGHQVTSDGGVAYITLSS